MDPASPIDTFRDDGTSTSIDDAFKLLGDDTRLDILKAMWEAYDPMDPTPVPFSELRDLVGVEDPGRFNYHLGKLSTHFIRHTADGYELQEAGKRMMSSYRERHWTA